MINTVYSQLNPRPIEPEVVSSSSITETAGYLSVTQLVNSMIKAGHSLTAYRKGLYDSYNFGDDVAIDPTRAPGFSVADAVRLRTQFDLADSVAKAKATFRPVPLPVSVPVVPTPAGVVAPTPPVVPPGSAAPKG